MEAKRVEGGTRQGRERESEEAKGDLETCESKASLSTARRRDAALRRGLAGRGPR
jgi:hypothetical protein